MASQCRFCEQSILWVRRGNGWHPPFDLPPEMEGLDFQLQWSNETQDWVAIPVDHDIRAKLVQHSCTQRKEAVRRQREIEIELTGEQQTGKGLDPETGWPPSTAVIDDLTGIGERIFQDAVNRRLPVTNPGFTLPGQRTIYIERDKVVKVKMSREAQIAVARRLSVECPMCFAKPFEWCSYTSAAHDADADPYTQVLHTKRRV